MNARTWIPTVILLALTAGATAGLRWTREDPASPQGQTDGAPKPKKGLHRAAPVPVRLVDQSPLLTARSLMPLATTFEEKQLALQAERLGNHSVDLAFSYALRTAATATVPRMNGVMVISAPSAPNAAPSKA